MTENGVGWVEEHSLNWRPLMLRFWKRKKAEPNSQPALRLMFVDANNQDGENRDLFVWASDMEEAKRLWHATFELSTEPDGVFEILDLAPPPAPCALLWHVDVAPLHITEEYLRARYEAMRARKRKEDSDEDLNDSHAT
jgi:hypothetical protein